MAILERLRTIVDQNPVPYKPDGRSSVSSSLFRCDSCEVTYIATEMDACPECDGDVEEIPTESDLGFGPNTPNP